MESNNIKILHVIPSLEKGGAERITIDICKSISNMRGVEVKLVVLTEKNEFQFLTNDMDVVYCNSFYTPSISGNPKMDLKQINAIIDEFKPNVIHSHLFKADFLVKKCLRIGIKYFTHCHDNMRQLKKPSISLLFNKKAFTDAYERRQILNEYKKCNNNFIAVSRHTENYLRQNLPVSLHSNIYYLNNAINLDLFRGIVRTKFGDTIRLVNIGSFVKKKNQKLLVEVIKLLLQQGISTHLDLIGDGPELNNVKLLAGKLGVEKNITFHGKIDDVGAVIEKSDVYVHSALYEPFGLVLVEAMAGGLPVITMNTGGNGEIIKNEYNGIVVSTESALEYADAVKKLIRDLNLYAIMSQNALQSVLKYDIKEYAVKLIELYQK